MKLKYFLSTFIATLVWVTGCAPVPISNQPTATVNPASLQDTPMVGPVTLQLLKNTKFQAQNGMTFVQLVDGKFQSGSGVDFLSVTLQDLAGFGDLNGDGIEDAAVILAENYGGTGTFEYLVPVFNVGHNLAPSSGFLLGDRVQVNAISITNGVIKLDLLTHAPNDSLCCPSQTMTQSFRFIQGPGLVMVHATSGVANSLREITINGPAAGSTVSTPFQLTGSVNIAPFENTLRLQVFDASNTLLYSGSIMVNSVDVGAPATFNATVDLSTSPVKSSPIRVELAELSMADGSLLDLDSVDLVLK